ncbi:hypothetical protein FB451DRAFT_1272465 [Mycena latifolia]|nr:hypothetical protein FB451DRAFT_1272465 [Mycena latifolia]
MEIHCAPRPRIYDNVQERPHGADPQLPVCFASGRNLLSMPVPPLVVVALYEGGAASYPVVSCVSAWGPAAHHSPRYASLISACPLAATSWGFLSPLFSQSSIAPRLVPRACGCAPWTRRQTFLAYWTVPNMPPPELSVGRVACNLLLSVDVCCIMPVEVEEERCGGRLCRINQRQC